MAMASLFIVFWETYFVNLKTCFVNIQIEFIINKIFIICL